MAFLWALLGTLVEVGVISVLLSLAWATHYYLTQKEIPHGICQPYKVKIIYFMLVYCILMDHIFWKLGFCREYALVSFLTNLHQTTNVPWKKTKLSIKNLCIHGVPVRLYQPKPSHAARKGVVHIHGGAGVIGSIASYEKVCRHIANESDSVVLSIGYSLPHQRPYPAQFQECLDVTIHFMKHAKDYGVDPACIIILGDSFGGLLTASVCQMMVQRDDIPKLRAQVLIYPCLQFVKFSLPSYMQNAFVPPLLRRRVLTFALQYLQKHTPIVDIVMEGSLLSKDLKTKYEKWLSPDNIAEEFKVRENKAPLSTSSFGNFSEFVDQMTEKTINPLLAEDAVIRQLPEMFLLTAQYDVLRDDGVLYKKRLEDNGVPVSWCHLEDGFHGVLYHIDDPFLASSCTKRGMDSVINYIRDL